MERVRVRMPTLPPDAKAAMERLRVTLRKDGGASKVFLITSSERQEGKTFLAMQLWRMMAEAGLKTLLIDADLRGSALWNSCMADEGERDGLVQFLRDGALAEQVLCKTEIEHGYLILAGDAPENPVSLLESAAFQELLEKCRAAFDCILIDAPSLQYAADVMCAARQCDGTLLAVRCGKTSRWKVSRARQLLQENGIVLLGMVLNRVPQ